MKVPTLRFTMALHRGYGPWPCSTNSLYRRTRDRVRLTHAASDWHAAVFAAAFEALHGLDTPDRRQLQELGGAALRLVYRLPAASRLDADNGGKLAQDAVALALGWDGDAAIRETTARRDDTAPDEGASLTVTLTALDDAPEELRAERGTHGSTHV